VSLTVAGAFAAPAQAGYRVGGGVEYLKTLGDIKDTPEFDSNAFGFLASGQYNARLFKIEGDVEWILDFGGSSKSLIQPQAYLLVGSGVYGGAGIGIGYFDGDWQNDPFYALRVGVDFTLGGLNLDAFTLYRFQDTEVFENFGSQDLNSITFGAVVRFHVDD
jgi:hypothetical protein